MEQHSNLGVNYGAEDTLGEKPMQIAAMRSTGWTKRNTSEKVHRRLISFGVLKPWVCLRPALTSNYHRAIYRALLSIGYRETVWQYIFDGQIGGLVRPGTDDIHIRFYDDRLFAEIEISRAFVSHFYGPRFNAKKIILHQLEGHVSEIEYRWLQHALADGLTKIEEASLLVYEDDVRIGPYASIRDLSKRGLKDHVKRTVVGIDWRNLSFGLLGVCSILLASVVSPLSSLVFFGLGVTVVAVAAPRPYRQR